MRAIIFDLDDTLYPRRDFVLSGFSAVASDVEERWGVNALFAFTYLCRALTDGRAGTEFQALCERHGIPTQEVAHFVNVFRLHRPDIQLPEISLSAIERLRRDRWRIGVLTNGLRDVQARKIDALGLAPMVDTVIFAEDVAAHGKPAPEAFAAVLRALQVPASRAICVGDDLRCDVYGARAAGLRTVRLKTPHGPDMLADDADVVIDSLEPLPAIAAHLLDGVTADVA